MVITIYDVSNYRAANQQIIDTSGINCKTLEELETKLKSNHHYHFRVHKDTNYIFFGDLDKFPHSFEEFGNRLIEFLKTTYQIGITLDDIKYTINKNGTGSYHYSVPSLFGKTEILKEMHQQLAKDPTLSILISVGRLHRIANKFAPF